MDEALLKRLVEAEVRRAMNAPLDERLKATRHENSDHLDRALLPRKIAPWNANNGSGTPGTALIVGDDGYAGWSALYTNQYRHLDTATGRYNAGIGTTAFYLPRNGGVVYGSTTGALQAAFYFDPADVDTSSHSLKVKLSAWAFTETNPTDSTLTVSLREMNSTGAGGTIGGVGASIVSATLAPNAATFAYAGVSSDAAFGSTAGWYVVQFVHSADPGQAMTYGYMVQLRVS